MLLHAGKRTPRKFIVTDGCPVNVPMSPASPPRQVRPALAADAIVAAPPLDTLMALMLTQLDGELRLRTFISAATGPKTNVKAMSVMHKKTHSPQAF